MKSDIVVEDIEASVIGEWPYAWIKDETTGEDPYDITGSPVSLPSGHRVVGWVGFKNTSNSPIAVKMTVWLSDPDGNVKGEFSQTPTINAGSWYALSTLDVQLDKGGLWKLHGKVEEA